MAIVGRLIRQKAAADAAERAHPERAAERIAYRAAAAQAVADRVAKFPILTAENFEAADAYQKTRIAELIARTKP